jgi:uncharacterized protein with HEPN domain
MAHKPAKFLFDALDACKCILEFINGKTYSHYLSDKLLRSGVERQLIIIGEALNQLAKIAPETCARITHYQKIVGFRNIVVHGYDIVENEIVWGIVVSHLPTLQKELETLLKEAGKSW